MSTTRLPFTNDQVLRTAVNLFVAISFAFGAGIISFTSGMRRVAGKWGERMTRLSLPSGASLPTAGSSSAPMRIRVI
jgi:hypothetical protein